jgi:hypothetical protein
VSPEAIDGDSSLGILVNYRDENDTPRQSTIDVGVHVGAAESDFLITTVETQGAMAGATVTVMLTLKDNAVGEAHEVTAELVPGQYFVPVDTISFLGDMKSGDSGTTQFKVSVSKDAIAKTCPLDVMIKYNDENNIPRQAFVTAGIQVNGEPKFEIGPTRIDGKLAPGTETVIEIPINNASDYEIRDAIARINIVNPFSTAPFSTTDDTAYIGTLETGETGIAKFKVKVDADALPKAYSLEVDVNYHDVSGNSHLSDMMEATVNVTPVSRLPMIIIAIVIVVVIAGIIFYVMTRLRRSAPQV